MADAVEGEARPEGSAVNGAATGNPQRDGKGRMLPWPGIVKTPDRRLNAQRRKTRAPPPKGAGMENPIEVWNPGAGRGSGNRHQYRPARRSRSGRILQSLLWDMARHLLKPTRFAVRRGALSALSDQDTYEWAMPAGLPAR